MGALVDVNVLVALLHARHAHSGLAVAWLESQDEARAIAICRVSQMGALRILTHPSVMKDDVKTAAEFWRGWTKLIGDDRFSQVDEPPELEHAWRTVTAPFHRGRVAETDAYLAAFAIAGKHRIVSFDRGMNRFAGVDAEILV